MPPKDVGTTTQDEREAGMSSSSELYEHLLLAREIRVLVVQPAVDEDEPIRALLEYTNIDEPCNYDAISYCWSRREDGRAELIRDIQCNGHVVPVTDTAEEAIKSFRRPDRERVLWLDALCINQSDIRERTQQVSMMAQIYAASAKTLIYLGSQRHEPDCHHALRCFRGLASDEYSRADQLGNRTADDVHVFLKWVWALGGRGLEAAHEGESPVLHATNDLEPEGVDADLLASVDALFDDMEAHCAVSRQAPAIHNSSPSVYRESLSTRTGTDTGLLTSINTFLSLRWFQRRWVLQETFFGTTPMVYFGKSSITVLALDTALKRITPTLQRALVDAERIDNRLVYEVQQVTSLPRRTRIAITDPIDTLYWFDRFSCQDGRDVLYALLSMNDFYGIKPDYSLSVEQTYLRFAHACTQSDHIRRVDGDTLESRPDEAVGGRYEVLEQLNNGDCLALCYSEAESRYGSRLVEAESGDLLRNYGNGSSYIWFVLRPLESLDPEKPMYRICGWWHSRGAWRYDREWMRSILYKAEWTTLV
ncbi:hypothetical protein LTR56_020042 [Elasticomyces elasticus]|nr:hypothetical protein LTR56_020042 [Elasticomyces elasticus]KAK4911200.1 hypothetical protein LTR49_020166 [Elasticomyces elasticus]KAK5750679.1 hypothetical protein LTS12_019210 [Elasticomyces elasticus]